MRFLAHESDDFQAEMEAQGLALENFRFVKRQGKLHVFYQQNSHPFKFFRKESTILNAQGKWEKQTIYLVFEGAKSFETACWANVNLAFQTWLKNLIQNH